MPKKPYTLMLQFEDFEQLWKWKEKHLSDDLSLYQGFALDPEFRGIGRVPKNTVIVRKDNDPDRQAHKLEPQIVVKELA